MKKIVEYIKKNKMACVVACLIMVTIFIILIDIRINTKVNIIAQHQNMPGFLSEWCGKRVTWYGDSITEMYGYCDLVDIYLGLQGQNCGFGGTAISHTDDRCMSSDKRMTDAEYGIAQDSEVIFVMGGINDWTHSVPLGDKELTFDKNGNIDVDVNTFYGACHMMFYNLTRLHPYSKIVVLGTTYANIPDAMTFDNPVGIYNNEGLSTIDYGDALCEIAGMWGIPAINVGRYMGMNYNNVHTFTDNIHPVSEQTDYMIAKVVLSFLSQNMY